MREDPRLSVAPRCAPSISLVTAVGPRNFAPKNFTSSSQGRSDGGVYRYIYPPKIR